MLVPVLVLRMLPSVKLYDDPFVKRNEVNDIPFKRLLATEFHAFHLVVLQMLPESVFRVSKVIAQSTGLVVQGISWFHS